MRQVQNLEMSPRPELRPLMAEMCDSELEPTKNATYAVFLEIQEDGLRPVVVLEVPIPSIPPGLIRFDGLLPNPSGKYMELFKDFSDNARVQFLTEEPFETYVVLDYAGFHFEHLLKAAVADQYVPSKVDPEMCGTEPDAQEYDLQL